ncbi:hypothetical protein D3C76_1290540 [compost metagenome]
MIASISIIFSAATLYLEYFHVESRLTIFFVSLDHRVEKYEPDGTQAIYKHKFNFRAQLTNMGNATATLMKVYLVIPPRAQSSCEFDAFFKWDVLSSIGWANKDLWVRQFDMEPKVVPKFGIVDVDGSLNPDEGWADIDVLKARRVICIALVTMDVFGERHVKVVPGLEITITNSPLNKVLDEVKRPIRLL